MSKAPLRIGVVSQASPGWRAGKSFTTVVLEGLAKVADPARETIHLVTQDDWGDLPAGVALHRVAAPSSAPLLRTRNALLRRRDRLPVLPGEWPIRELVGLVDPSNPMHVAKQAGLDVVLPLMGPAALGVGVRTVGWIADFIHRLLPELFDQAQLAQRDRDFLGLAAGADAMMFSSETVARQFRGFYPEHAHKANVARFPSVLAFHPPSGDPREAARRYGLPDKFALVINQFWPHKNAIAAVNASRLAAARGTEVPLVLVGALGGGLEDGSLRALAELLQQIARSEPSRRVFLLGPLPTGDLIGLLRAAAVVIQPSRSEGWSTTVEDAKALGRPLICSDLEVLREQAPDALGFFGWDRPDALADLLVEHWPRLAPGPEPELERASLGRAAIMAAEYGATLAHICRAAAQWT